MSRKRALFVVLAILFSVGLAAAKKLPWQTGKLTHIESRSAGSVALPVGGMLVAAPIHEWVYVVEAGSMVYQFERKSPAPLNVTINGNVKFAVEKSGKAFLRDDTGKKFAVVTLRKTATNQKP